MAREATDVCYAPWVSSSSRRVRVVGVAAVVSLVGAAACTLLVDTNELSGGAPPRASTDAGPADGPITTVAPPDGAPLDASVDAGPAVRTDRGLVAFFAFDEDGGREVHDTADGGDALKLVIRAAPAPDGDGGVIEAGSDPGISWAPGHLTVSGRAIGESTGAATAIQTRCRASGELSVEAWVRPLNATQDGPARIVTMSVTGGGTRNFTLGQAGPNLIFRLPFDGGYKEIRRVNVFDGKAGALMHLVVTAKANGELVFYVDGAPSTDLAAGIDFDFQPYHLAIANEIEGFASERRWRGDYHLLAVYDRVLTQAEVSGNFRAGPDPR